MNSVILLVSGSVESATPLCIVIYGPGGVTFSSHIYYNIRIHVLGL